MTKISIIMISMFLFVACSESERPAAQAKHALDSAQQAADHATQHAKDMAEQAQKALAE